MIKKWAELLMSLGANGDRAETYGSVATGRDSGREALRVTIDVQLSLP